MKRHRKHKFLEEIKKTPIIEVACKNTGISRQTFYRWFKTLPGFEKEYLEAKNYGDSYINDVCESKQLQAIQNGKPWAIRRWQDHHDPTYMKKDNLRRNLNLIQRANKNITLEEALELAEGNIKESVQMGNIKDSKYLLEKRDSEYSRTRIEGRGILNNKEELNNTEEEIKRIADTYKRLGIDSPEDILKGKSNIDIK